MDKKSDKKTVAIAVLLFLSFIVIYQILWASNTFVGDRVVTISRGMSFKQAVDSLEAQGVIRSRMLFDLGGRLLGLTRNIQIGKYLFRSGVSNHQILEDLSQGASALLLAVTIREGIKATTQALVYQRELGIDSARYANLAHDPVFTNSLDIKAKSLEGYLFPETYLFYWQTDEERLIRRMVGEFQSFYVDSLQVRAQQINMSTNEVLTLASIVEGEAILDYERPIIAGVYYNRLKRRMRLQADPTIQYIIGGGPRRLRYIDLHIPSPYNTYRNYGLPPGPVNNPGRASILAVLYPTKHNFLYFVADGRGGHVFSKSYIEHRRAVHRYRRILSQLMRQAHE